MQGMSTFESLHPRAGGTGPDRTQFTAKVRREPGVILVTEPEPAVQPMDTAPTNGEVIEVLFEDEWYKVHWSDSAYDGSPYGTEGWATLEDSHLMLDVEGWRYAEGDIMIIDEFGDRIAAVLEAQEAEEARIARDRREKAAAAKRRTAQKRTRLEALYKEYFGEDVSGQNIPISVLQAKTNAETTVRQLRFAAEVLRDFGF